MNPPTVLSVRIKNDKEGPQTGDVVLNGSAVNDWGSGNKYDEGDVVVYNGQFYQAIEKHESGSSFDYTLWEQIGIPDLIVPEFETNTHYNKDELVLHDNKLYKAKAEFTSSTKFYSTDWDNLTGATYTFTSEDKTVAITLNGETADFSVSSYVGKVKTDLQNQLDNKVDVEAGKGLSTNDYTTAEKTKVLNLAGIFNIGSNLVLQPDGTLDAGFTVSFDASLDKTSTNGVQNKVVAQAIEDTNNDITALSGRVTNNTTNITQNASDIADNANDIADLQSDVADIQTDLNGKVDKVSGKDLSSNDYTDADQTKVNNLAEIYNIGARLTLDPSTNTLSADDQTIDLESTTGTSTTKGMTQKAITDAINSAVSGGVSGLATVATSGSYNDLIDTPDIDTTLSTTSSNAVTNSAITTEMNKKANSADLATVATSGSYNDLSDKPFIPTNVTDLADGGDYVLDTDLATVAKSGDYNDLLNIPTITAPGDATISITQDDGTTAVGQFTTNQISDVSISLPEAMGSVDLSIDSSTYVITLQAKNQRGENMGTAKTIDLPLESVVVNGAYKSSTKEVELTLKDGTKITFSIADLISGLQNEITSTNKLNADLVDDSSSTHKFATAAQITKINSVESGAQKNVQADWSQATTTANSYIKNKPTLATVATSGKYTDLTNKPTIPVVTLSTTDIGEGATLAANHFYGVYE